MADDNTELATMLADDDVDENEENGSEEELDPLAKASADLRSESDDELEDEDGLPPDKEEEDDVEDDMDDLFEEEDDKKGEKEDDSLTLTVPPHPNDERNSAARKSMDLDGLDQPTHDLIQGHIKRSQKLGTVEKQLETAQEHETAAMFVNDQPLAAMLYMEHEDAQSDNPAGYSAKYVENWLQRHPKEGMDLMSSVYHEDDEAIDPATLERTAKLARKEAKQEINDGLRSQQQNTAQQRYFTEIHDVVGQAADTLDLDEDDRTDLLANAARRIKSAMTARVRKGQDERLPKAQLLELVQAAAVRFGGKRRDEKKKEKPEDTAKKFKRKADTAKKHRKVSGGRPAAADLSDRSGSTKGAVGIIAASDQMLGRKKK